MPLYIYGCPECEIELEELRPAWRADEPVDGCVTELPATQTVAAQQTWMRGVPA